MLKASSVWTPFRLSPHELGNSGCLVMLWLKTREAWKEVSTISRLNISRHQVQTTSGNTYQKAIGTSVPPYWVRKWVWVGTGMPKKHMRCETTCLLYCTSTMLYFAHIARQNKLAEASRVWSKMQQNLTCSHLWASKPVWRDPTDQWPFSSESLHLFARIYCIPDNHNILNSCYGKLTDMVVSRLNLWTTGNETLYCMHPRQQHILTTWWV